MKETGFLVLERGLKVLTAGSETRFLGKHPICVGLTHDIWRGRLQQEGDEGLTGTGQILRGGGKMGLLFR